MIAVDEKIKAWMDGLQESRKAFKKVKDQLMPPLHGVDFETTLATLLECAQTAWIMVQQMEEAWRLPLGGETNKINPEKKLEVVFGMATKFAHDALYALLRGSTDYMQESLKVYINASIGNGIGNGASLNDFSWRIMYTFRDYHKQFSQLAKVNIPKSTKSLNITNLMPISEF